MYRKICLPALAILCLTSFELRAATHVWSGAVSGLWSNDANWSAGAAPQNGETDVVLVFPAGGMNKTMTNDVSVQNIDLLDFQDYSYVVNGAGLPMSGSIRGQFTHIYNPVLLLSDLLVSGLSLSLSGTVSGSFGISSSGHLFLAGANQYTGITTSLLGGHIEVANDLGLGTGNGLPETGTVVEFGGVLELFNASIANEALSISERLMAYCYPQTCVWGGPIRLTNYTEIWPATGSHLVLSGAITGAYILSLGYNSEPGTSITLGGANTFAGPTAVHGKGRVNVLGSTPSVFTTIWDPSYSADLGVAPGAVIGRLDSTSGGGELGVAGAVAGSAAITNGLLLNNAHGKLSIRIQSAVLADQFAVGGPVDISSATLAVGSSAFDPAAGTSYVIVANDGVDAILGTFAGLPEGWVFTANARNYRISYAGGDGNDIVLTRVVGTPVELQTFSAE